MFPSETIKNKVCPVHDLHPIIEITGNQLKIICCCKAFHDDCTHEIMGIMQTHDVAEDWSIDSFGV